jgi:hypothetical protein
VINGAQERHTSQSKNGNRMGNPGQNRFLTRCQPKPILSVSASDVINGMNFRDRYYRSNASHGCATRQSSSPTPSCHTRHEAQKGPMRKRRKVPNYSSPQANCLTACPKPHRSVSTESATQQSGQQDLCPNLASGPISQTRLPRPRLATSHGLLCRHVFASLVK